jgi:hypothetical protein
MHPAAMSPYVPLDDGQTESGAAVVVAGRATGEPFEDPFPVLGRNTRAVVLDTAAHEATGQVDEDAVTASAVPVGVLDQIRHWLPAAGGGGRRRAPVRGCWPPLRPTGAARAARNSMAGGRSTSPRSQSAGGVPSVPDRIGVPGKAGRRSTSPALEVRRVAGGLLVRAAGDHPDLARDPRPDTDAAFTVWTTARQPASPTTCTVIGPLRRVPARPRRGRAPTSAESLPVVATPLGPDAAGVRARAVARAYVSM